MDVNQEDSSGLSSAEAHGVLTPLSRQMNVDLVVTQGDAAILILHDKPLPDILKWIEFDYETETMLLVFQSGQTQDIGLVITPKMKEFMADADKAVAIYLDGKQAKDMGYVPLIKQETVIH